MTPDLETTAPPDAPHRRWNLGRVLLFLVPLFLFYVFPLGFWPVWMGANESAHAYLALALYERGETAVDDEVRDYFPHQDLVYRRGHYYSNKAPGPALLLVPAAAAIDAVAPGRVELAQLGYFGRVLMLTIPFLLFLFLLGRRLETFAPPATAWGLTLAYALGTSAAVYAVLYFGHNLAAMGVGAGFLLATSRRKSLRALAGLLTGIGVACEYQTAGIALVVTALAAFDEHRRFNWRLLLPFVLGAAAAGGLLMLYNAVTFESAVQIGYGKELANYKTARARHLGFSFPSPYKLLNLTFSPALGLFFHSPWLLLIFPAAWFAVRHRSPRRHVLVAALAAAAALPLIISSHMYWVGDAIAGPRYLAAGLPFLLFPIAAWLGRRDRNPSAAITIALVAGAVLSAGLFACLMISVPNVNTTPETLLQNPLSAFAIPALREGITMFTVANWFGAGVGASIAISVVLFLLVALGFFAPLVLRGGRRPLVLGLLGLLLGTALFAGWTQIGHTSTAFADAQRELLRKHMALDQQDREAGRFVFMRRPHMVPPTEVKAWIQPFDPEVASVISNDARVRRVASGFRLLQGGAHGPDGALYVADQRTGAVYRFGPTTRRFEVFRGDAGSRGKKSLRMRAPGTNGIAFDREGRLTTAQYGPRRVARLEANGRWSTLADRWDGKRFNSPSSLAYRRDGTLYFTDPPFGIDGLYGDPRRELAFSGIFRLAAGEVRLLTKQLIGPCGLAFSPDQRFLYTAEWVDGRKKLLRFAITEDGGLAPPALVCDLSRTPFEYPTDGLLVDRRGRIFVTAGGGVWIVSPTGKPLGFLKTPWPIGGLSWGGTDGRTLYLVAATDLLEIRVLVPGCTAFPTPDIR